MVATRPRLRVRVVAELRAQLHEKVDAANALTSAADALRLRINAIVTASPVTGTIGQRIVDFLQEAPDIAFSPREIAAVVGTSADTARKTMLRMVEREIVVHDGYGAYRLATRAIA